MNKYESAIANYEKCRGVVSEITSRKKSLTDKCSRMTGLSDMQKDILSGWEYYGGCIENAWRLFNHESNTYHEGGDMLQYENDFSEILESNGCKHCNDAYAMNPELKEAKKAFGVEKMRLSLLGKGLIQSNSIGGGV